MKIEFRKSFEKDLDKISSEALLERIQIAIEEVESAESMADVRNAKKLKAEGSYYRLRVGDYRLGIILEEETAIFVRVLHRKEIYRYFP